MRFNRCLCDDSGFTLLEAMASLAILGIGVVLVIRLFSGGLGLARASEDNTELLLIAREKISGVMHNKEVREGVFEGGEKGIGWKVEVKPYGGLQAEVDGKVRLYEVSVTAKKPGGRACSLTSLKAVE